MKKCKFCNTELTNRRAKYYCSNKCQGLYRRKEKNDLISFNDDNRSIPHRALRNYLIDKYGAKCMGGPTEDTKDCRWDKINPHSGLCPIELEHIDGDSSNNSLENLRLLCPSCHSLTATYKGLNRGKGRHKRKMRYHNGKSY